MAQNKSASGILGYTLGALAQFALIAWAALETDGVLRVLLVVLLVLNLSGVAVRAAIVDGSVR